MSLKLQLRSAADWRKGLVPALLLIAVLGLLVALWEVCLSQVRDAEARHKNQVAEQRAVEDCVRHNAKGSLISCADRAADDRRRCDGPLTDTNLQKYLAQARQLSDRDGASATTGARPRRF
jgi:hypothetical protein